MQRRSEPERWDETTYHNLPVVTSLVRPLPKSQVCSRPRQATPINALEGKPRRTRNGFDKRASLAADIHQGGVLTMAQIDGL